MTDFQQLGHFTTINYVAYEVSKTYIQNASRMFNSYYVLVTLLPYTTFNTYTGDEVSVSGLLIDLHTLSTTLAAFLYSNGTVM